MDTNYQLLPELFLRAPFYSFAGYDLDRLPEVLGEEAFRNAIWLASPALYKVLQAKDFSFGRLNEKERLTLYKYYNRMCFRPTPFGSFASFTLLERDETGPIRIADEKGAVLHLLPDLQLLSTVRGSPVNIHPDSLLSLNPTLYRYSTEFRFVQSRPDENGRFRFSLEAVAAESLVIQLVAKFKKAPTATGELVDWLHAKSGADRQSIWDYVDFLISEQVLFSEDNIGMIGSGTGFPSGFRTPDKNMYVLKAGPLAELAGTAHTAGCEPCFYAALERPPVSGGLSQADRVELQTAINVLKRLSVKNMPPSLEKFISDFTKRFDQEKVPLMLALDPDYGISYANLLTVPGGGGLLANVRFPKAKAAPPKIDWSPAHRLLFRLLAGAQVNDKFAAVSISPEDIDELPAGQADKWPPTQAVMFRKTEEYLLIEYAGGASATALVGRFSLFSGAVAAFCRKLSAAEMAANPGVLFADIDQRSHLHTDNINRRENIYDFYIPVNCYSDTLSSGRILPGDLLLSVRNGELVLESKSLRKRVIPRLSTAFNYRHNDLALFRLLCDLQFQQLSVVENLDLERFFPGMDFYPRVVSGQAILCLARWKINEKAVTALLSNRGGTAVQRLRIFRSEFNIPAKVSLGASDQQLTFNLANEQEALFFLDCLKGSGSLTLQEYLPPSRDIKAGNQPLAAQFVAFILHHRALYRPAALCRTCKNPERNFMIGSEWLYLKVFCSPQAADRLLVSVVRPFLLRKKKYIRQWFFIRYDENGHHLRLRFCTLPEHLGNLLAAFRKAVNKTLSQQLIRDFMGDTYRRELERYGHGLITLTENVFWAGSEVVCAYLAGIPGEENEYSAFTMAFYSAYEMIRCFIPDRSQQLSFTGGQVRGFLEEFGGGKQLKTDLGLKYRSLKSHLELSQDVLSLTWVTTEFRAKFKILLVKSRLLAESAKKNNIDDIHALLADVVHMQMNRCFRVNERQHELLVYFCLDKAIRSLAARYQTNV